MENSLNCITFACRKDRCQIITAINMEVRLNKFLSDSGLCSRREADKFIEMGRVTVNGSFPTIGQKVTEADIIQVDEETIPWGKRIQGRTIQASTPKITNLLKEGGLSAMPTRRAATSSVKQSVSAAGGHTEGKPRREHYVKYNKYAAARRARKEQEETGTTKPLSRGAVAQQQAASPKSAALRKTSRNNPANRAKYHRKTRGV